MKFQKVSAFSPTANPHYRILCCPPTATVTPAVTMWLRTNWMHKISGEKARWVLDFTPPPSPSTDSPGEQSLCVWWEEARGPRRDIPRQLAIFGDFVCLLYQSLVPRNHCTFQFLSKLSENPKIIIKRVLRKTAVENCGVCVPTGSRWHVNSSQYIPLRRVVWTAVSWMYYVLLVFWFAFMGSSQRASWSATRWGVEGGWNGMKDFGCWKSVIVRHCFPTFTSLVGNVQGHMDCITHVHDTDCSENIILLQMREYEWNRIC